MAEETELTFLGTGTSQGVPIIGCRCAVCRSQDWRDKRLRSSVMVEHRDRDKQVRIIIDTGPDFRQQMLREEIREIDAVLYTHEHMDHIAGMDDVRAFNYVTDREVEIYCEPRVERALRRVFDYAFAQEKYPGVPQVAVRSIDVEQGGFDVHGVWVVPVRGMHFKLPVLGFRIGEVAYLTDMNRIEESEVEKIKGVKVLVINALQREEHISHFSLDQALEVIGRVEPGRAYLTHMSHRLGTCEQMGGGMSEGVFMAYDGLKIKV